MCQTSKEVAKFQINDIDPQRGAGGWWIGCLSTDPDPDFSFVDTIRNGIADGKKYIVSIEERKKDKTRDQNAFYWKMARKIATLQNCHVNEVYKRHVADMCVYSTMLMKEEAFIEFEKMWTNGHLGRFCETRESKNAGMVIVLAYYGCSDFDSATMNQLIANCLQDCIELGIPVLHEDEKRYL